MMALLSAQEVDVMRSPIHFGLNGIWLVLSMWELDLNGSVREKEVLTAEKLAWPVWDLVVKAELQEHFSHTVMDVRSYEWKM